ncbi:MAG: hypothetical protein ACM3N6_01365 [Betaproteobacteria bacterium]
MDTLQYVDSTGWHVAAQAGFHWSATQGTTAMALGALALIPTAVNSLGEVVGAIASDGEPFIWKDGIGGERLRPLLLSKQSAGSVCDHYSWHRRRGPYPRLRV